MEIAIYCVHCKRGKACNQLHLGSSNRHNLEYTDLVVSLLQPAVAPCHLAGYLALICDGSVKLLRISSSSAIWAGHGGGFDGKTGVPGIFSAEVQALRLCVDINFQHIIGHLNRFRIETSLAGTSGDDALW